MFFHHGFKVSNKFQIHLPYIKSFFLSIVAGKKVKQIALAGPHQRSSDVSASQNYTKGNQLPCNCEKSLQSTSINCPKISFFFPILHGTNISIDLKKTMNLNNSLSQDASQHLQTAAWHLHLKLKPNYKFPKKNPPQQDMDLQCPTNRKKQGTMPRDNRSLMLWVNKFIPVNRPNISVHSTHTGHVTAVLTPTFHPLTGMFLVQHENGTENSNQPKF